MDTSNWKWFRVGKLFHLEKCKCSNASELLEDGNEIPYIGAKKNDNGIMSYVLRNEQLVTSGNCIVFIGDGQGSIGYCTYQPSDFIGSTTLIAGYNKKLNVYNALFLVGILDRERYRYSFGRKYKKDIIANSLIKLPAIKNAQAEYEPDWNWIENYVKETLIPKLPQKARNIWQKTFDTKPLSNNKLELNIKEWQWFEYQKLFSISGSKTTPKEDLVSKGKGIYPYVTTQAVNNGVEGFYDYYTEKGNVLTIDSAVLGYCSFQEKDFSASDHVEVLTPLFSMNKYIALFLTTIMNKEQYRYNYGRKCSQIKLKTSKIKLPAIKNAQGEYEPDWQWMEDYIKGLPYSACL